MLGFAGPGIPLGGFAGAVPHEVLHYPEGHAALDHPGAVGVAEVMEAAGDPGGPGGLVEMVGDVIQGPGKQPAHLDRDGPEQGGDLRSHGDPLDSPVFGARHGDVHGLVVQVLAGELEDFGSPAAGPQINFPQAPESGVGFRR